MDGVLFDTIAIAEKHLTTTFPELTSEMQRELLTGNFHDGINNLAVSSIQETEEERSVRIEKYVKEKSNAPMYDGMKDLVKKLHSKGYVVALNTSARNTTCMPCLEVNNIVHFFDFIGTVEISKSKVEKFKIIKEKYDAKDEEMLFVTDTLGDLREADTAGVPTVCVTWGAHDEKYFYRESHENLLKIINSVSELESFIEAF